MDPVQPGIPGLRGTDHVGFTVPDLEVATRFLMDVIGCERFYDLGPISAGDDWMRTQLNVDPRAVIRRIRNFRCFNGANYEVFEYEVAGQRTEPPRNSDVGGHHVALYVDDLDAAIAHLRSHGVQILGEPVHRSEGPNSGRSWVYFLAPWGMQFELVSYPRGMGYERTSASRMWDPRHSGQDTPT